MKAFLIAIINIYQQIISPLLRQLVGTRTVCRYTISCSEFSKRAIQKYGIIRGLKLSSNRLISCQPWFNKGSEYGTII